MNSHLKKPLWLHRETIQCKNRIRWNVSSGISSWMVWCCEEIFWASIGWTCPGLIQLQQQWLRASLPTSRPRTSPTQHRATKTHQKPLSALLWKYASSSTQYACFLASQVISWWSLWICIKRRHLYRGFCWRILPWLTSCSHCDCRFRYRWN